MRDWGQLELPCYTTARGASRVLKRFDVPHMPALATVLLGAPHLPAYAARGDLVSEGAALGVCVGARLLHPGPQGLVALPLSAATACWKI